MSKKKEKKTKVVVLCFRFFPFSMVLEAGCKQSNGCLKHFLMLMTVGVYLLNKTFTVDNVDNQNLEGKKIYHIIHHTSTIKAYFYTQKFVYCLDFTQS